MCILVLEFICRIDQNLVQQVKVMGGTLMAEDGKKPHPLLFHRNSDRMRTFFHVKKH